ncbi:MAG TPA: 30S ribosomal protein S4 [Myxococcota bacterium]|nr:30S ribosomal protein S4 [Myxococcota bacterium]
MARYRDSLCKVCRREGAKLFLKGERCYTEKCAFERRAYGPGQHGQNRRKPTQYCTQLREKQKVRSIYGMLEKQFRLFFGRAERERGITGDNLLRKLETRLDSVVARAGFAVNRNDARQLVRHGHVLINGRRVSIPSYSVKAGDVVEVASGSRQIKRVVDAMAVAERRPACRWLEVDRGNFKARVASMPDPADFRSIVPGSEDLDGKAIREELIVELYSK